jgi:hypothetical protein
MLKKAFSGVLASLGTLDVRGNVRLASLLAAADRGMKRLGASGLGGREMKAFLNIAVGRFQIPPCLHRLLLSAILPAG